MRLPLAALLMLAPVPSAAEPLAPAASISSIVNGSSTYSSSQTVHIWRGEAAQMEVFGSVVGTALGIDLFLADGVTPAPLMVGSIVTRKPSSSVIRIDVAAVVTRATYVVRFRYAAAVGNPDEFKVRVYDRGTISSISASNVTPKTGETVTITATGQNLEKARLDLSQVGQSPVSYAVVSRSATSLSFTLKFNSVGMTAIGSYMFLDEDIGSAIGTLAASYAGNSSRALEVMPNPVITSVAPAVTVGNGTVTIGGSGLNPSGWTPTIRVDDMSSTNPELSVAVLNGAALTFTATSTVNYRDLYLRYRRSSGAASIVEVPLPYQVMVQMTPHIQRAGDVLVGSGPADCATYSCPSGSDTRVFGLKVGATHDVQGLWLQPAPNTPVVVKHGTNTLNVTYSSHNLLRVTVPAGAGATSGPITVQTGGGTATSPGIAHFGPPPSGLSLLKQVQSGSSTTFVPVSDGTLHPGTTYRVVGSNLHFVAPGTAGIAASAVAAEVQGAPGGSYPSYNGNGYTSFTLPSTQPVGSLTLTYRHWGGSATVGTFQVAASPVLAAVDQMIVSGTGGQWWSWQGGVQGSVESRTIQGGTSKQLTVTVKALTTGLVPTLTVTSSDPAVSVGGPYTFTPSSVTVYSGSGSTPTVTAAVTLQVQPIAATRTATLTFNVGNSQGAVGSVPVTLAPVSFPKLESVAFEPTEMTGGSHAKARIILGASPPMAMTLPVTTKDAVQVPSSVTVSARETVIQVPTPAVTQTMPVTITVGSGADARSAALTLHPVISVQSLTPATSPIPAGRVTDGTLTLDHAAWEPIVVSLTSSAPAVLSVPASVTMQRGQRTVRIPLTASPSVSSVVSVNVEARIGTRAHVATIRVGLGR